MITPAISPQLRQRVDAMVATLGAQAIAGSMNIAGVEKPVVFARPELLMEARDLIRDLVAIIERGGYSGNNLRKGDEG